MMLKKAIIAAFLALTATFGHAAELDEARVKALVYEAIRENPAIVMEAIAILQREEAQSQAAQQAAVLSDQRQLLENDPNAPVLGNPEGDVTVVEFFDYNCPYCRKAMPEVQALLEADPNVRLVYREWPILGEGSVFAAKAALAARKQGMYEEFHWTLMNLSGRVGEGPVLRVAKEIGLDIPQLRRDMESADVDAHIATSMKLSQALGFNGTPSFVIGDALAPGLIDQEQLKKLVAEARMLAE